MLVDLEGLLLRWPKDVTEEKIGDNWAITCDVNVSLLIAQLEILKTSALCALLSSIQIWLLS